MASHTAMGWVAEFNIFDDPGATIVPWGLTPEDRDVWARCIFIFVQKQDLKQTCVSVVLSSLICWQANG
jgi:hypothetical protein